MIFYCTSILEIKTTQVFKTFTLFQNYSINSSFAFIMYLPLIAIAFDLFSDIVTLHNSKILFKLKTSFCKCSVRNYHQKVSDMQNIN
jgi:hypothetical protein